MYDSTFWLLVLSGIGAVFLLGYLAGWRRGYGERI